MDTRTIRAAVAAVEKKRRGDALIGTADEVLQPPAQWFTTGSLALDRICRGFNPGGIPLGRIVHVAGAWSTGKSLWADHLAGAFIAANGAAYIAEAEGSRDAFFSTRIGLDHSRVVIDRPAIMEAAFENFLFWHETVRKKDATSPVLYVLDSLDASRPERAMGDMTESRGFMYGGGKSEVLGTQLSKLTNLCARYPTTAVLINQIRDSPGVMFGPTQRTPGGNPPHFYASLEIWLSGAPRPERGYVYGKYQGHDFTADERKKLGLQGTTALRGLVQGRWVRARVTKSKVSGTFDRFCDYYLDFTRGISRTLGLTECLQLEGLLAIEDGKVVQRKWENDERKSLVDAVKLDGHLARFKSLSEWASWLMADGNFARVCGEPPRAP